MSEFNPMSYETIEEGTTYQLPNYEVVDGKGIQLTGNQLYSFTINYFIVW